MATPTPRTYTLIWDPYVHDKKPEVTRELLFQLVFTDWTSEYGFDFNDKEPCMHTLLNIGDDPQNPCKKCCVSIGKNMIVKPKDLVARHQGVYDDFARLSYNLESLYEIHPYLDRFASFDCLMGLWAEKNPDIDAEAKNSLDVLPQQQQHEIDTQTPKKLLTKRKKQSASGCFTFNVPPISKRKKFLD